jgi:hypothetical protein
LIRRSANVRRRPFHLGQWPPSSPSFNLSTANVLSRQAR